MALAVFQFWIPTEILCKPGKLNEKEFDLIKEHALSGYEILKEGQLLSKVPEIVLQHHERIDGSGYPYGLKKEEITREAKIIGVVDVFDAISSDRPYRKALGIDTALEELKSKSGVLYEPEVVEALVHIVKNET